MDVCSVNVVCGAAEDRILMTGLHKVADIYCQHCKENLGWKYVSAQRERERERAGGGMMMADR